MKILKSLQQKAERHFIETRQAHPFDEYCRGQFMFGNCKVTFWLLDDGKDIEIHDEHKDRYYDNVADWLCYHTINLQDIEVEETDEWDCHGFRDEQDFINYKYG